MLQVTCLTKIFHCNVNARCIICLNILKEAEWSPAWAVGSILLAIQDLMHACNIGESSLSGMRGYTAEIVFDYMKQEKMSCM